MRINHNIAALNTYRQLNSASTAQSKSMEKLSSGLRINKAGDDAAGLAISEKMRGQIRGLDQASKNAQDSISLIQTAEGALNETHDILQRMRELSVQSSNDTNTESDRKEIQKEVNQLIQEVDRIANTTEFNTQKLLDGNKVGIVEAQKATITVQNNSTGNVTATFTTAASANTFDETGVVTLVRTKTGSTDLRDDFKFATQGSLTTPTLSTDGTKLTVDGVQMDLAALTSAKVGESITISLKSNVAAKDDISKAITTQIGANSGQTMYIGINSMKSSDLGIGTVDITDATKANAAITQINNAIESVSGERSKLGAFQNRLEHTINNLNTSSENLTAAESRIRDVDMAKEMMSQTKNSILSQAAQAMLAQANQQPQGVLQLLR
ncbi:flagellin [Bacillus infantis]|uniref:Flagellin n=1 Tax=Bacillus infantis TaxID=324767 RepID=A0A5D4SJX2_9BACI|nr:flagellin [Bacillus infantis]TYS63755.1 flagellin [Bacillus infantis]